MNLRIGLIDVDGHNFPNIPLMKLSAWHKSQCDSVEWYEPMFSGHMDKVYMSKVFSFTPDYEYFVDADEIVKGGSGYCISLVDGKEQYDKSKDQGQVHFAYDRFQDRKIVEKKFRILRDITGWERHKVSVYVLVNFDTTPEQDMNRILFLRNECHFSPYVMIYDKEHIRGGAFINICSGGVTTDFCFGALTILINTNDGESLLSTGR